MRQQEREAEALLPRSSAWRLSWILGLAVAALALLARSSVAQAPPLTPINIGGTVVNARSGKPLGGAFVSVEGVRWGAQTDQSGHFTLHRVEPGEISLTADQLGYKTLRWKGVVTPGDTTVDLALVPQAKLLKGLRAEDALLTSRRRGTGVSVQAFDQVTLANTTQANVVDFLNARAGLLRVDCPGVIGSEECYWVDGQPVLPIVYIDEVPVAGGMSELRTMWPQDLFLLEVYDHGGEIRAYTKPFMLRAARTDFRPMALGF